VIVGAGPAGLSAAVYMGRFKRRTLVLDCGDGRWSYGQVNHNYLGFPAGVKGTRLHALGRKQAERFGVAFEDSEVTEVQHDKRGFHLKTKKGTHQARTLIWAAGVRDRWPDFQGAKRLVGRHLFWCIVCDGWRTRSAPARPRQHGPVRRHDAAVPDLHAEDRICATHAEGRPHARSSPSRHAYVEGKVRRVVVQKDCVRRVVLDDKRTLEADILFSPYGSNPRTEPCATCPWP
jgi:thioredoxin reductase (NADPH)